MTWQLQSLKFLKRTFVLFSLCVSFFAQAAELSPIKVAVASNFKGTLIEIAQNYKEQTGQEIIISSASTGTLYNQIRHGAPFDVFLSADKKRAELIENSDYGIAGSRFTYAQGQLVFWAPGHQKVTLEAMKQFTGQVAIANPKLAPYGMASMESLKSLQLWSRFSYVQGANISQTYQFIDSGNVQAGFVAYAQILQKQNIAPSSYALIPSNLFAPIVQQGVLLSRAEYPKRAQKFINYLISDPVKALIKAKGYQ